MMGKRGDKSSSSTAQPDGTHLSQSGASAPGKEESSSEMATLMQYMMRRDEVHREEMEAAERRRKEELDATERRFEALLQRLAPQQPISPAPQHPTGVTHGSSPAQALQTPKPSVQPPSVLQSDASLQQFREWKRRWHDYAQMIDLPKLSQEKQAIQLRQYLSPEMLRRLEHVLGVSPDQNIPVDDAIAKLETHVKSQNNEAIRRKAFSLCKQDTGEPFEDFFVRLKSLALEVDLCKANSKDCSDEQMKHAILMGVRDQELVEKLTDMPRGTLQEVVDKCKSFESTKKNADALRDTASTRAVSQYKKNQKVAQKKKFSNDSPTKQDPARSKSDDKSCFACGRSHLKGSCPAMNSTCGGCGNKGHWKGARKCPARTVECHSCNFIGHFDQYCPNSTSSKRTSGVRRKPKLKKDETKHQASSNVVSSTVPANHTSYVYGMSSVAPPTAGVRNLSSQRPRPKPSPRIRISVAHSTSSGTIETVPDTGADTTVVGLKHLHSLGLTVEDLHPPSDVVYYNADGTKMSPVLGSFQGSITYYGKTVECWIDVQDSFTTPLLSWQVCRALGIIHKDFPKPLPEALTANRVEGAERLPQDPRQPVNSSSFPLKASTSRSTAEQYFRKQYAVTLRKKGDLQQGPLQMMDCPPMKIHLRENAQPFAVHTPRVIPLAFQDAVKAELDSMVTQGVITPMDDEPSEWCHPLVAVPKPNGGVRITTDLSKLNAQVARPAHPSPTPFQAIRSISPQAKFFTTIDALCGYWQIPLAEEDQHLTTFITPYGRYRYRRGPMGFAATGDAFCLWGDKALQGIQNCIKVVDDILLWDEDYLTHLQRVDKVLSRCKQFGITLNSDKFVLAAPEVSFCGYRLSKDGIAADPGKVSAIADFPTPANITDVRSFMGLVNQLAEFSPEISSAAAPLRPLMSPKRTFIWTSDHTESFANVKKALSQPPVLATFDAALPTILQTDASRLYGLGYVLLQDHGGGRTRLVQCGSRFLTDAETRYATIELELQAVVWAMSKCKYYLAGLQHFSLVTDHRPLVPILNSYSLDAIENPRLQRLKEKISPYIFTASWRAGKELCIPDALSRSPVSQPTSEDVTCGAENSLSVRCLTLRAVESVAEPTASHEDLALEDLRRTARQDTSYQELLQAVKSGFPSDRHTLPNALRPYWKIRAELYCDEDLVIYGVRVVVPSASRRRVLARLHDSHSGIEATKRRARAAVYWPGIDSDIANVVNACEPCQIYQPSQQKEPWMCDDHPTRPFESVSADFFSVAGKNFLLYADRFSGWPVVFKCGTDTTSATTIRFFREAFRDLGVPIRLRTDGGPQFTSQDFTAFLKRWGVRHDVSSPHYPQSNGHAEANVKKTKRLIQKTAPNGNVDTEEFASGLLELRNTPSAAGESPAQVLFGSPLRSLVPAHAKAFTKKWHTQAEMYDRRAADRYADAKTRYNEHARPLPKLLIGSHVRVQDPVSKRWDTVGVVMGVGRSRDYNIKMPSGRILWRNRRYLRPVPAPPENQPVPADTGSDAGCQPTLPRRSERLAKKRSVQDVAMNV